MAEVIKLKGKINKASASGSRYSEYMPQAIDKLELHKYFNTISNHTSGCQNVNTLVRFLSVYDNLRNNFTELAKRYILDSSVDLITMLDLDVSAIYGSGTKKISKVTGRELPDLDWDIVMSDTIFDKCTQLQQILRAADEFIKSGKRNSASANETIVIRMSYTRTNKAGKPVTRKSVIGVYLVATSSLLLSDITHTEYGADILGRLIARLIEMNVLSEISQPNKKEKKKHVIKLGCDPEFEVVDGNGKVFVPAEIGITGTGVPVGADGTGESLELRPAPSDDPDQVIENMKSLIETIKDVRLSVEGNVYPIGCHIHFSVNELGTIMPTPENLKMFDHFLGYPCSVMNGRKRGKGDQGRGYGAMSAYRTEPHGFEYRTLPSAVCAEPKFFKLVLKIGQAIMMHMAEGNDVKYDIESCNDPHHGAIFAATEQSYYDVCKLEREEYRYFIDFIQDYTNNKIPKRDIVALWCDLNDKKGMKEPKNKYESLFVIGKGHAVPACIAEWLSTRLDARCNNDDWGLDSDVTIGLLDPDHKDVRKSVPDTYTKIDSLMMFNASTTRSYYNDYMNTLIKAGFKNPEALTHAYAEYLPLVPHKAKDGTEIGCRESIVIPRIWKGIKTAEDITAAQENALDSIINAVVKFSIANRYVRSKYDLARLRRR
jgi:hypothetical protein